MVSRLVEMESMLPVTHVRGSIQFRRVKEGNEHFLNRAMTTSVYENLTPQPFLHPLLIKP